VIAGLLAMACSPKTGGLTDYSASIDPAIELFVEGRYAEAAERLEVLSRRLKSQEGLVETYLYLGRAYLALGQHDRAIDAFTAGASYGGAGPFHEYLVRLKRIIESAPQSVAKAEKISRAQLAQTIDRVVLGIEPGPDGKLKSGEFVSCTSVRRGFITPLPDGGFYPDSYVTRGSFYAVVCKLLEGETSNYKVKQVFPGGFGWVTAGGTETPAFVTGREAVSILQRVAELQAADHGR
jgi:tetratricopeptide (TPR) repeat protein